MKRKQVSRGKIRTKAGPGGCDLLPTSIYERKKIQEPGVSKRLAGVQQKGLSLSYN